MNALIMKSVLAAALLAAAGATMAQAMPSDRMLEELARTGTIVTTHGIWIR